MSLHMTLRNFFSYCVRTVLEKNSLKDFKEVSFKLFFIFRLLQCKFKYIPKKV